jgi:hypothetical protein
MTQNIDFFHHLDKPVKELPVEFSGCIQVQNISGRTLEVADDLFVTPLSTFVVHEQNSKTLQLIDKKMLKVRPFTVSAAAEPLEAKEISKKKRTKKGQSTSSHQELEGAVADLAAVITGEVVADAAEPENVEQLMHTDSAEQDEKIGESSDEGSPETDNQSV